jgi:hypothetical protein
MFAAPALEPILHCNVNERAKADPMIKTTNTVAESERIARCIQQRRSDSRAYREPASAQTSEANRTLLHIDSERAFDPMFRELIRPIQARYDLAW